MPNVEVEHQGDTEWLLYGGRLVAQVPVRATFTPAPDDRDPLNFKVVMVLDIVAGRLSCTSLIIETLSGQNPAAVTSEDLRRVPVASYVESAGIRMGVLKQLEWSPEQNKLVPVDIELPSADFAAHGMTDQALNDAAHVYAVAQATGGKPSGILLNTYGLPRPTASRWLTTARRRGILSEDHQRSPAEVHYGGPNGTTGHAADLFTWPERAPVGQR